MTLTSLQRNILILCVFLSAIILYSDPLFVNNLTPDLKNYVFHWYKDASRHGLAFIKHTQSDYPPLYLYLIWLFTYFHLKEIVVIKGFSILFNFLTARMILIWLTKKYGQASWIPVLGYAAMLFLPTAFLNSVMWGQCDIIYTFFCLVALYRLSTSETPWQIIFSLIIYSIGISFKLHPIFIFPVFWLVLKIKRIPIYYLLIIPFIYLLLMTPALIVGRDFKSLVALTYMAYPQMTRGAPSVYAFLSNLNFHYAILGNIIALIVIVAVSLRFKKDFYGIGLSGEVILKLAMFFCLLVPFLLPQMHERYFFMADILSVLCAFYFPGYFKVMLCVQTASLISYFPFLHITRSVNLPPLAFLNLIALLLIGFDIQKNYVKSQGPSN